MPRTRKRQLETLSGDGDVYRENAMVCHVRYALTVMQLEIAAETTSGTQWLEGQKEITGRVIVPGHGPNLCDGETYCLHLKDGHEWNFFAKRGDPIAGAYECVTTPGGFK